MAIAFVAAADLGNNGGTTNNLTASYTTGSGSDRFLIAAISGAIINTGQDDITGVTYNSVAMTLAVKFTLDVEPGNTRYLYIYYLANPTSGSNSLSVSSTATHYLLAVAADYTGVRATGQPDASETNSTPSASSLTDTITTIAGNSWATLVSHAHGDDTAVPTAGTGLTRRISGAPFNFPNLFDSNTAITPAGNYNMTTTPATTGHIEHAAASFAPAPSILQRRTLGKRIGSRAA